MNLRLCSIFLLAGCDSLFGLDHVDKRCADPSAGSSNEDGDAWSDACDLCPAIPETEELDEDGDGVGNACDPHPTQRGDSIVLFEGFDHGIPNGWIQRGTWREESGAVAVTSGGPHAKEYLLTPMMTGDRVTVSTNAIATPMTHDYDWKIGVSAALRETPLGMISCAIGRSYMQQDVLQLYHSPMGISPRTAFSILLPTTLSVERDGSSLICTGTNTAGTSQITDSILEMYPVRTGLALDSADPTEVRFEWLMVVETN